MTFRKRRFWFLRRFALALAVAAATASPAAAIRTPDEVGGRAVKVSAPSGGGSIWNDVAYAFGGAAALAGVAGAVTIAYRARKGPRLARA